jgi:hypothetical protein
MSHVRLTSSHRIALLTCAFAAGALALSAASVEAGCNSGSSADTDLLSSIDCQAGAPALNATAVGAAAFAAGVNSTVIGFHGGPQQSVPVSRR